MKETSDVNLGERIYDLAQEFEYEGGENPTIDEVNKFIQDTKKIVYIQSNKNKNIKSKMKHYAHSVDFII